jgi:methylenetetrahydrofolate dehydrogenase (NADP+)/methenyltetrahydrofolate cyclohydrolase
VPGKVMDGRGVAQKIRAKIKEQVKTLQASNVKPRLVTILVGDNPSSKLYLKNKHTACLEVGMQSSNIELPATTSLQGLERTIQDLNEDPTVTGILLQLPLPSGLDDVSAIGSIAPEKDVDGLHPSNLGQLCQKQQKPEQLSPCTPRGVMVLLAHYQVQIAGAHAVVINRTRLVGRPLSQLLLNKDATVTVCHSKTRQLKDICRQADILITGIGRRSEFTVTADMIKPGAAVVDVGTSSVGGKTVGDLDFTSALEVASYVTPVPGGVGPMTITMLLYNTMVAACAQKDVILQFNVEEL